MILSANIAECGNVPLNWSGIRYNLVFAGDLPSLARGVSATLRDAVDVSVVGL